MQTMYQRSEGHRRPGRRGRPCAAVVPAVVQTGLMKVPLDVDPATCRRA